MKKSPAGPESERDGGMQGATKDRATDVITVSQAMSRFYPISTFVE
jgi:hypothetical protein